MQLLRLPAAGVLCLGDRPHTTENKPIAELVRQPGGNDRSRAVRDANATDVEFVESQDRPRHLLLADETEVGPSQSCLQR